MLQLEFINDRPLWHKLIGVELYEQNCENRFIRFEAYDEAESELKLAKFDGVKYTYYTLSTEDTNMTMKLIEQFGIIIMAIFRKSTIITEELRQKSLNLLSLGFSTLVYDETKDSFMVDDSIPLTCFTTEDLLILKEIGLNQIKLSDIIDNIF